MDALRMRYECATDALRVRYGCAASGSKFQMSFRKLAFFTAFAELLFSGHAAIRAEMKKTTRLARKMVFPHFLLSFDLIVSEIDLKLAS